VNILTWIIDNDYRFFRALNALAGNGVFADTAIVILAEFVVFLLIAGLALFILLDKDRNRRIVALKAIIAAFVGRAIFVSVIRLFYFRPRPFVHGAVTQLVDHSAAEGSFPSGHAAVMFAIAFTLVYKYPLWGWIYLALAAVSGAARVIAGVHFPLDILGGMFVGALAALFICYCEKCVNLIKLKDKKTKIWQKNQQAPPRA
jgi:undecaprenyl-diphosphatase